MCAVGLAELGVLRDDDARGERVCVAPEHAGGGADLEFDAACQHVDAGGLQRSSAEERRLGVEAFEIAAHGDGLGQESAVIEFKRRQLAERIAREVIGLLDVAGHDGDFNERDLDLLLGEEDADAARVRRRHRGVVEFHGRIRVR